MTSVKTQLNWEQFKLNEIVQLIYGEALPEQKRVNGTIPVYGSNGIIGWHNEPLVKEQTIVVGRKGSVGKANLTNNPCWVIDTAFYTELISKELDIEYLFYFLSNLSTKLVYPKGVKPGINRNEYLNNSVALPVKNERIALLEQQIIVKKIKSLFSEIDKAIEKVNIAISEADNLFRSALNKKISSGFAEGWKEIPLINLTSFFNDGDWIEKRHQSSNEIRLIQTGNVGIIDFRDKEEKRYINEETFNKLRCKDVLPGDILISRLPDPVGRACIIPKLDDNRLITAVDCTIVRLEKGYIPEFINYLLNSRYAINQVHSFLSGSSRKRISRKNLEKIMLPIPMLNEKPDTEKQRLLVDELTKIRNLSMTLKDKYVKQLNLLEMMKQSLLNQAFQGKL
ncbi:restriction endonuclease subunit S [Candidatus Roizmanbacteria bacterium]|nr:restriction endonuclease subunit S [Candidatus Roizmanbacteria bacterium]